MDSYTNYEDAIEECERLQKMLGRAVIPQTVECACDHWRFCDDCGGRGVYLELVYDLCGHRLEDDDANEECREFGCREREDRRKVAA